MAPTDSRRRSSVFSWLLILVAVAGLTVSGLYFQQQEEETDDTSTLVILTLQAKMLIAAGGLLEDHADRELRALEQFAATPGIARALAALHAFMGGDQGLEQARGLLSRHPGRLEDPEELSLHDAVRRAVESPDAVSEEDRQRIAQGMGWFGKLLLASASPEDDPLRREVLGEAFRTFSLAVGFLILGLLGTLVGGVLLVPALIGLASGRFRARFGPPTAADPIYLEAFAVYLGLLFLLQVIPALFDVDDPLSGVVAVAVASFTGLSWPLLKGLPRESCLRDLGLHRGEGLLKEARWGLVGYLAILPLVVVGFLMMLVLVVVYQAVLPPSSEDPPQLITHPVVVWVALGNLPVRLLVLLLASAFAPFVEELMFRGAFLRGVRRTRGPVASALITAFVFAVIHPQGLLVVPPLMALAFGFALLREWRGSLVAPMVAHAVHNGALVLFMWLLFG